MTLVLLQVILWFILFYEMAILRYWIVPLITSLLHHQLISLNGLV
jgi:hypothetical protein